MKPFFALFRIENLKKELSEILHRFPLSLGLILGLCVVFFVMIHGDQTLSFITDLSRVALSIIITFFLSLGVYIYSESQNYSKLKRDIFQVFPLVFGVVFFLGFSANIDDFQNIVWFLLTLIGILGFLFIAPYFRGIIQQKIEEKTYYSYFYALSVVILLSLILGGVTLALGYIGISATITLFDLSFSHIDKLFGDWAVISLSLVAPIFALTQLPKKETYKTDTFSENIFFSFLIKFVALPFIFVYFIILYAYTVKVLLNFGDWPKGEVSWLVIGFSLFGYITYIFSYIFEEKIHLVSLFRKYFPYIVIPQIGMLFYAIYLRIAQYDITTNRYFVVVFGIWLLSISLYFILSKKKTLAMIPAILTLFTLLISVGPWSVFSLPESRQLTRLEKNLTAANILSGNTITPLENYEDIDPELSGEIYDGIRYVCGFNNCESIKELFPIEYSKILAEYTAELPKYNYKGVYAEMYREPSQWEITDRLSQEIKVRYYYKNDTSNEHQKFIYISQDYSDSKNGVFPLDISGYETLYEMPFSGEMDISLDTESKKIILKENSVILEEYDISDYLDELYISYKTNGTNSFPSEKLTLTLSGESYDTKIYFSGLSLLNPDYKETGETNYYTSGGSGYMLLKKK